MPDWRDAAAYAPLLDADRSLHAWEWLRRDPLYRAAAAAGAPGPETFGLAGFEPPGLGVPHARAMWRSQVHPFVLPVDVRGAAARADAFDPGRLRDIARVVAAGDTEHLLLSDGLRAIRLDGPAGAFSGGPVVLAYAIAGLASAGPPLVTLRRLLALCRTGRFSRSLHPREPRARRWVMMLRARDGIAAGADQRQIAEVILGRSVAGAGWRTREPSLRSQAQRLVRCARRLADGGYAGLLR